MGYDFSRIISVEGRLCVIDSGFDKLNQGSLVELVFLREEDIISAPDYSFAFDANSAAQIDGTLLLVSGAEGYRFRFTPETSQFSETSQETDDGEYFDQSLNFQIPKDRPEVTWLKHRMHRPRYAIIYRDANGIVKLLRNQRVKFDLNTANTRSGYNGHIVTARRATETPALHWQMELGESLESIYTAASLSLGSTFFNLPEGWQEGKVLQLSSVPVSADSLLLIYNQSVRLRHGEHYILTGTRIVLQFADFAAGEEPGTIQVFNANYHTGTAINTFSQGSISKTTAYSIGETIALSAEPESIDQVLIVYNKQLALRPGVDFSLSGTDAVLAFAGDPDGDTDTFDYFFPVTGSALAINGWKQYPFSNNDLELASGAVISLPHTPIAGSQIIHLDDTIFLTPGVDYNLNNNELEILFPLPIGSRIDAWYAY